MLKSLLSAFLMYSRIPVPKVDWKEENRRYSLGFFPLIGFVIGGILVLWRFICNQLSVNQFLFSAGAVIIPIIITGGIHIDGYCDVNDAKASFGSKEKRLEIMSDPHIGSFAVLKICIYLIFQTALFSQIESLKTTIIISTIFIMSRALSGLTAVTFKPAKSDGSLQSFVRPSHKKIIIILELFFIIVAISISVLLQPILGTAATIIALLVLIYHRYSSYRDFGGITGDLCGWFLLKTELYMLVIIVLTERIMQLW